MQSREYYNKVKNTIIKGIFLLFTIVFTISGIITHIQAGFITSAGTTYPNAEIFAIVLYIFAVAFFILFVISLIMLRKKLFL